MKIFMAAVATAFVLTAGPALAADLITKPSPHSVTVTVDRLVAAVEGAGATVFARVDHAAGATAVGAELLGTPALQAAQTSGVDLPMRVVVYQDEAGQVLVAYHPPAALSEDHGIPADAEVLKKITGALNNLTNKAISK
jgi:uncharacterized protein (DUF302 family)